MQQQKPESDFFFISVGDKIRILIFQSGSLVGGF